MQLFIHVAIGFAYDANRLDQPPIAKPYRGRRTGVERAALSLLAVDYPIGTETAWQREFAIRR